MAGALGTTADAMSSALDASASSFGAVSDSIDKLYSDANDGATTVADELTVKPRPLASRRRNTLKFATRWPAYWATTHPSSRRLTVQSHDKTGCGKR